MRSTFCFAILWALSVSIPCRAQDLAGRFRTQEIDRTLTVGYGVVLEDLDNDGKRDIVIADSRRVIWLQNPTWKLHTILDGQTAPDNVCLDAADIDGDGKLDLALGAGWRFGDSKTPGTLQWLRQGAKATDPWQLYPIPFDDPTLHRLRWADVDADGRKELFVVPLLGKGSSAAKNWSEAGVRVLRYDIPANPMKDAWKPQVIADALPVMHNFQMVDVNVDGKLDLLTASYDGVHVFFRNPGGNWSNTKLGAGDQSNPNSNRGSSEIKLGRLKDSRPFIATIEPWHGNNVVVYTLPTRPGDLWDRKVIDAELKWGHAIWCADLDGDKSDELIIGVRDPLNAQAKSGVRIYKATDAEGKQWQRSLLDPGGVAVEDLAAADLDGDGDVDIVAVGRATKNVRIYWNEGKGAK